MKTKNFELLFPLSVELGRCANEILNELDSSLGNTFPFRKEFPSANILKTETGVLLEMALPGCSKEDIDVSIEKDILTISSLKEDKKEEFSRKEFSYKSFKRSFIIPESFDKDSIKSSMNNGMLNVTINKLSPEAHNTEKKKIPVE